MTVERNDYDAHATEEMKITPAVSRNRFWGAHAPSRARFGALAETF
jgi:hypothetical protein